MVPTTCISVPYRRHLRVQCAVEVSGLFCTLTGTAWRPTQTPTEEITDRFTPSRTTAVVLVSARHLNGCMPIVRCSRQYGRCTHFGLVKGTGNIFLFTLLLAWQRALRHATWSTQPRNCPHTCQKAGLHRVNTLHLHQPTCQWHSFYRSLQQDDARLCH